jgi:endonuclease-8
VPEGDTIHRVAERLRPVLVGQPLVRLDAPRAAGRRPRPGTGIAAVDAVGKHLLVRFDDGSVLRTHLRMTGSWHLYRTGERWRKPAHLARATVEVPGWVAVCFSAPVVAFDGDVAHLGPDLTTAAVDLDAAAARLAQHPADEIGAALLDQRIAAGIGNMWKSETLWSCRVDPFACVGDLDDTTRRRLLATASKLLQASVGAHRPPMNVYRRRGQPCRRCGTPVRSRRQGEQQRTTYWCPTCQASGG